jgi:hypothetical protein
VVKRKESWQGLKKMSNRSVKQFYLIFLIAFSLCMSEQSSAIELAVLNDIGEMVKTKRVVLRVVLSPGEKLVYREMLRFSTDNEKIRLCFWKASVAAKTEYIEPFHQAKRVFTDAFELELTYEGIGLDEASLPGMLAQTSVAVSYVSLDEASKHNAQTVIVSLAGVSIGREYRFEKNMVNQPLEHSLSSTFQRIVREVAPTLPPVVDGEIVYLKRAEVFYEQMYQFLARFIQKWGVIFIIFIFGIATGLFGLRIVLRKVPKAMTYYPESFADGIFVLVPIACVAGLGFCGAFGVGFVLFGGYSLLLGCYLLVQYAGGLSFKAKSLAMAGCLFITASLPLILKGLLAIWL